MNSRKLILPLLFLCLVLPGCRREPIADKPFVVAIPTYPGFAIPFLAQSKGFFPKNVQIKRIDDAAAISSGLIRGDIDATFTSVDAFVLSEAQGVRAVAVLLSDESRGADGIVVKPEISKLNDLKGKKVAANLGWPGHFFLLYNLREAGIPYSDVTLTNMDADKAGSAFLSGALDAAVTWEPWLSTATSGGKGKILISTATRPGVIVDPMLVSERALKEERGSVQAFVNGYYKALEAYRADPAGGGKIMAEALGLPAKDFTAMTATFHLIGPDEAIKRLGEGGSVEKLFGVASEIWKTAGVIDRSVDSRGRTTDEFVKSYLASKH